ncbi:CBS domain-containing protein [Stackebrandtia soli]|uniref:CBS domain-containing protein n=1 Tax=Stackebrandtia soli TaxID=1892856 RepID=UPI0039EC1D70
MSTVADVMTENPACFPASASVTDAAQVMRDRHIGDVLVVDDDRLIGIVTDRDIVVRGVASDDGTDAMRLEELATATPVHVSMSDDSDMVVTMMRERGIRRVPVCDGDGRPIGVVSLGDLAMDKDPGSALAEISHEPPNN